MPKRLSANKRSNILDELAMMFVLLPVLLPTILALNLFGMNVEEKAIWFGILMLVVVSIGRARS